MKLNADQERSCRRLAVQLASQLQDNEAMAIYTLEMLRELVVSFIHANEFKQAKPTIVPIKPAT